MEGGRERGMFRRDFAEIERMDGGMDGWMVLAEISPRGRKGGREEGGRKRESRDLRKGWKEGEILSGSPRCCQDYEGWMNGLRRDFAEISPRFRRDFAEISPRFRRDFAEITPSILTPHAIGISRW
jgi:hypothetical protein